MRWYGAAFTVLTLMLAGATALAGECLEPVSPDPQPSDALIKEYGAEIEQAYRQYFSELEAFFACYQVAWARAFAAGQATTQDYQDFLTRRPASGAPAQAPLSRPAE